MQFTFDFLSSVKERLGTIQGNFLKDYSVAIGKPDGSDGEMGMPPLLDVVRYLTEWGEDGKLSVHSKEQILKHAIIGKLVKISYKGEQLSNGFTMNSLTDPLDQFDDLRKNPPALMLLMEIAALRMVEKSLPPRKESDHPAAAVGSTEKGSQPSSVGKRGAA